MKTIEEKIEEIKNEGYNLSISDMISESIDLYKEHFGLIFGFFALNVVISLVLSFVAKLIPYGIGSAFSSFIQMPMSLGILYVVHRIKNNRDFSFENFFDGYKDFAKIIIINLITFVILLPVLSPAIIFIVYKVYNGFDINSLNDPALMADMMRSGEFLSLIAITFLLSLGAIYVGFCLQFASMLVLFLGVDYGNAFKWSFSVVNKNFFSVFGFNFLIGIVSLIGIFACFIGMFFTLPVVLVGKYILFYHVFDVKNLDHPMRDKIHDYLEDDRPTTEEMFR
jgi:hypothetical protein